MKNILSNKKEISNIQFSLSILLVVCLILSNILVIKPFNLFGIEKLSNTYAFLTFPITYVLSDVFSEVYGYKWSRLTATWAFIGTFISGMLFRLTIILPGNSSWTNQEALETVLGGSLQIALASIIAFWLGDLVNDIVFKKLKEKHNDKYFGIRAILSSLAGKYVDGAVFTFLGLSFLPLQTKINMIINCPFVQVILEICLLPLTYIISKALKAKEADVNERDTETPAGI